MILVEVIIYIN